jgi:hypothetical protein
MEKKVEATEVVFRLPANTGVFWVRDGAKVRRYAKYDYRKERAMSAWLGEARPAD